MREVYVPTPAQVAGMQAVVAKRLAQWDQLYDFAAHTDPAWDGDTDGTREWELGYVEGKAVLLDEIREILGMERRREQVQHWCAGWNLPGYSSDPEFVLHGGTLPEALAYLRVELERELDHEHAQSLAGADIELALIELNALAADTRELVKDAELQRGYGGRWAVEAGPLVYWVMPCFMEDCDQIETEEG